MKFPRVVLDLLAAREVLLRDGWTRGLEGMSDDGPCCLRGAIKRVTGDAWNCEAAVAAEAVIPTDDWRIGSWNDHRARNVDDVLGILDDAASLALSEAVRP